MNPPVILGGTWIDVVGDVIAYASSNAMNVYRVLSDGVLLRMWRTVGDEPPMFHRLAVSPNGMAAVFAKGNFTGQALIILQSGVIPIGTTHGNNPGAIYWDGDEFMAEWIETPGVLAMWRSSDGHVSRYPIPAPWTQTATGILDLTPEGVPLLMDEFRVYQQPPWSFTKPQTRAGVTVGQWGINGRPELDRIIVGLPDGRTVFTGLLGTADDPRVSVQASGRIIVAAFGLNGAVYQVIDPPYPPAELPPVAAPVPVPPTPKPEPPPMAIDYLGIITDVRRKYGHIDPLTREWTPPLGANHWLFLVEVAQRTGTQLFRKDGGERVFIPPLKLSVNQNLIGRGTLGNQWADILVDAENQAKPAFSIGETPADGPYIDVSGIVLPGTPPPVPVPTPDPTPTPTPATDLTVRVAELEAWIPTLLRTIGEAEARLGARIGAGAAMDPAALRATVEAILSGYEASGNTSRTIAHSHTVKLAITRKP